MSQTFYDVLGVAPDASQAEIRRAYREQVKECHPDVSDDPDAAERFRVVSRAEEVLGDERERERYDRLGHEGYLRVVDEGLPEDVVERSRRGTNAAGDPTDGADDEPAGGRREGAGDSGLGDDDRTGGVWATGPDAGSDNPSRRGYSPWSETDETDDWWDEEFEAGDVFGGSADATAAGPTSRPRSERRTGRYTRSADRATTPAAEGSAGGFWSAEVDPSYDPGPDRGLLQRTFDAREARLYTVALLFIYPIFVYFSATPALPPAANVLIAGSTAVIVAMMLTEPGISVVVFGVWSLLSPVVLSFVGVALLTAGGLALLGAFWGPFALALLVASAVPT